MRVAVMIIALCLALVIGGQSFLAVQSANVSGSAEQADAGASGILLLVYVLGAAFAFRLPAVSACVFWIGGGLGMLAGIGNSDPDFLLWSGASIVMGGLAAFGSRETAPASRTSEPSGDLLPPPSPQGRGRLHLLRARWVWLPIACVGAVVGVAAGIWSSVDVPEEAEPKPGISEAAASEANRTGNETPTAINIPVSVYRPGEIELITDKLGETIFSYANEVCPETDQECGSRNYQRYRNAYYSASEKSGGVGKPETIQKTRISGTVCDRDDWLDGEVYVLGLGTAAYDDGMGENDQFVRGLDGTCRSIGSFQSDSDLARFLGSSNLVVDND